MKTTECLPALRALADPSRLKIVEVLLRGGLTVNGIAEAVGTRQYNVSKHIRILKEAGIVQTQREAQSVVCHVAPEFRARLRQGGWAVDLGCCSFRFAAAEAATGVVERSAKSHRTDVRRRRVLSGKTAR